MLNEIVSTDTQHIHFDFFRVFPPPNLLLLIGSAAAAAPALDCFAFVPSCVCDNYRDDDCCLACLLALHDISIRRRLSHS